MITTIVGARLLLFKDDHLAPEIGNLRIEAGRITAVGDVAPEGDVVLARGQLLTPGLIDCHTHAIFAGSRAHEFAQRARGATYLEIAASGGGIANTRAHTVAASDESLQTALHGRLDEALRSGITTVEVKSGYDLSIEGELRLLRIVRAVAASRRQHVVATALCHVVPAERIADRAAYVRELCESFVPSAATLATSLDIYADEGAFTLDEATQIFASAKQHALPVRAHAGQFRDLGVAELVAASGGLSIDHVEQISEAGMLAAAAAGVVAVMLPSACVQLRLPPPPVARLRQAGVRLALATDFNPGSSCTQNLPLQMWLACTHFGMTLDEAWLGVTGHAAAALGRGDIGELRAGARADLCLWPTDEPADLAYQAGRAWQPTVWVAGKRCAL